MSYSLDVIGDRWTLHIVRDLTVGLRRNSDLLNSLPGIGTNLLAKRLKELEQADVVTQRKLPPPAASTVYELTERGRGLQSVIGALTQWGSVYLEMPPPEDAFMGLVPAMYALRKSFAPEQADGIEVVCQIEWKNEAFRAYFG